MEKNFSGSSMLDALLDMSMVNLYNLLRDDYFLKSLKNAGFDFNLQSEKVNKEGANLAMYFAKSNLNEGLEFLSKEEGINFSLFESSKKRFALLYAGANLNEEAWNILLLHPSTDVNQKNINNSTALIYLGRYAQLLGFAKDYTRLDRVERMLKRALVVPGIDIDARNKSGYSALSYFSQNEDKRFRNILLEVGANDYFQHGDVELKNEELGSEPIWNYLY